MFLHSASLACRSLSAFFMYSFVAIIVHLFDAVWCACCIVFLHDVTLEQKKAYQVMLQVRLTAIDPINQRVWQNIRRETWKSFSLTGLESHVPAGVVWSWQRLEINALFPPLTYCRMLRESTIWKKGEKCCKGLRKFRLHGFLNIYSMYCTGAYRGALHSAAVPVKTQVSLWGQQRNTNTAGKRLTIDQCPRND